MKTPKTLYLIECRQCNGSYYGGKDKLVLHPGKDTELPDEISVIVRKVARCSSCKEKIDRTLGGRSQYER